MTPVLGATLLAAGTQVALAGGKRRSVEKLTPGASLEDGAVLTAITQLPTAIEGAIALGAGALAAGSPSPSLIVAPRQWVAFGDRLAPAAALLNGATIERAPSTPPAWFTLETDRPALLLVNGVRLASPGPSGLAESWRMLAAGPELRALRTSLLPPPPPPLCLWAGTRELASRATPEGIEATLPASAGAPMAVLRLVSPVGRSRDPNDARRFGVAVLAVALDGKKMALDSTSFGDGFYPVEHQDEDSWRWTNGNATLALPPSATPRTLAIRLAPWHTGLEPA